MKIERVCIGCKDKQDSIDLLSNEIDSLKREKENLISTNINLCNEVYLIKNELEINETYTKALERRLCELQKEKV